MRTMIINYGPGVDGQPDHHGFEVVNEYGETTGSLCLGELIEHVTCLVHPKLGEVRYTMATPEQWANRWKKQSDKLQKLIETQPEQLTEDPDHGGHI